jgi:hypothetical protein
MTQMPTIAINILVSMLEKLLVPLFVRFAYWFQLLLSNETGERPGLEILRAQISPDELQRFNSSRV